MIKNFTLRLVICGLVAFFAHTGVANAAVKDGRKSVRTAHSAAGYNAGTANGTQGKPIYGILAFDEEDWRNTNSIVEFSSTDATAFTNAVNIGGSTSTAGAFADGYYYVSTTVKDADSGNEVPDKLLKVDIESKTFTQVGTTSGLTNFFNDMTYDNTGKKMYAISRVSNMVSALFTIDLTSGAATEVAELDGWYFALACTYDGQLYGLDSAGNILTIDKVTGETKSVSSTGLTPKYFQSMEFDHSDKTLYWAASVVDETQTTIVERSYLSTIDINTGEVTNISGLGSLSESQVAGLYIPFVASADNTPSAVSGFTVTPGANGATTAKLAWTNPLLTFGGQEITGTLKIEIFRNGEFVEALTGRTKGEKEEFNDIVAESGVVTYTIVASNENGTGVPAEVTVFVGSDKPGPVGSLSLVANDNQNVTVSWAAPVKGAEGGWFDAASLTYNVVRLPDNKVIATSITTTSVEDNDIAPAQGYSYKVTAVSSAGEGVAAETETKVLGPALALPYTCSFDTDAEAACWTIVDLNADGVKWTRPTSIYAPKNKVILKGSVSDATNDDWLISHVFEVEEGATYNVEFKAACFTGAEFKLFLVQNASTSQTVQELQHYTGLNSTSLQTLSFSFVARKSGLFNLALQDISKPNIYISQVNTEVTGFMIEKVVDVNLEAKQLSGNTRPVAEVASEYSVKISNLGAVAQDAYTILLRNGDTNEIYAQLECKEQLAPQESRVFKLTWMPAAEGTVSLVAEVVCKGDAVESDNVTEPLTVAVKAAGSAENISVGDTGQDFTTLDQPFAMWENNSAALNIYSKDEIGQGAGVIEGISYKYNSRYNDKNVPVKVYLANTDLATTAGGWIPENQMTKVFEGEVKVVKGTGEFEINFPTAFEYDGRNLAVLTIHSFASYETCSGVRFKEYKSPLEGNGARYYAGGDSFTFSQSGEQLENNSVVSLFFKKVGSGIDAPAESSGKIGVKVDRVGQRVVISGEYTGAVIVNVSGATVAFETEADGSVDTSGLRQGVYILKVTTPDRQVESFKLMIAR